MPFAKYCKAEAAHGARVRRRIDKLRQSIQIDFGNKLFIQRQLYQVSCRNQRVEAWNAARDVA
jgi:hypothetical protein